MEFDEIISVLTRDARDEESDHDKYMKLADELDNNFPDRGYGGIIRDIAGEEETHRAHIRDILKDIGADTEDTE